MEAERQIAALFCITAAYYGRPISDAVAQMYAADLSDLSPIQVGERLTAMRRDPKRRVCPLPAEVREAAKAGGDEMSAEQVAARVVGAISRFGHPNATRARAYVGEDGWSAIEDLGGWADVCGRLRSDQVGTFTAQARELCRAKMAQRAVADFSQPAISASRPSHALPARKRAAADFARLAAGIKSL